MCQTFKQHRKKILNDDATSEWSKLTGDNNDLKAGGFDNDPMYVTDENVLEKEHKYPTWFYCELYNNKIQKFQRFLEAYHV